MPIVNRRRLPPTAAAANESHPTMAPAPVAGTNVEAVSERFPNGNVKIERQVTKDAGGNYVNHGTYTAYDLSGKVQMTRHSSTASSKGCGRRRLPRMRATSSSADQDAEFVGPFTSEATFVDGNCKARGPSRTTTATTSSSGTSTTASATENGPGGIPTATSAWKRPIGHKLDGEVTEWGQDGKENREEHLHRRQRACVRTVGWYTLGQKRFEG